MRLTLAALLCGLAALVLGTGSARAFGGNYTFDGGTAGEQAQVRAGLNASSFDFDIVQQRIVIHVERGTDSYSQPGQIWLDADLLDAGRFSWGTVQHEYAHQIDFFLLTPGMRAQLQTLLGGSDWCYENAAVTAHDDHACERFASTLAAAYWQSPDNTAHASVPAARFRSVLTQLLGLAPLRTTASANANRR